MVSFPLVSDLGAVVLESLGPLLEAFEFVRSLGRQVSLSVYMKIPRESGTNRELSSDAGR